MTSGAAPLPGAEAAYRQRLGAWQAARAGADRRYDLLSAGRAVLFLAAFVLAWLALTQERLALAWAFLPAAGFGLLAFLHGRVAAARDRARRGEDYFLQGLDRLAGTRGRPGEAGERYRDPAHLYADDLDLFGRGGLFELLCTCRTAPGEARLASWLLRPAPARVVRARQEAVRELAGDLALREDLAVAGAAIGARLDREVLACWGAAPDAGLPRWLGPVAFTLGLANLAGAVGALRFGLPPLAFLVVLVAGAVVSLAVRPRVAAVLGSVDRAARQLDLLAVLARRLERESPRSPLLADIVTQLHGADGAPASVSIARLDRLVGLLDSRRNQLFLPLAALLLWSTQLACAMERWRVANGVALADWVDAVAEAEALASLATFAFEWPDHAWPELLEGPARLEAAALAHPLLPRGGAVPNDVRLGPERRLWVVSGSNMSGKSTLMRSVGINVVLAQAGAPVRAARLRMSPLAVGASFRAADSLQDGRSRFYAEIERLRQVMDLLGGERPVLFLLDELLSGTNSHDRAIGASAVVRHLVAQGAVGMVTTHDLALAAIADGLGDLAANVHFEDRLEDGELRFDYRLKPGVVTRSNALELMRSVGVLRGGASPPG